MSPSLLEPLESRTCLSISFLPAVQSDLGAQSLVASGDVTGDQFPDLIAKGADAKIRVFRGLGDGRFDTQALHTLSAGPNVTGIAVADFNRDGMLDLAVSTGGTNTDTSGLIAIFLNQGNTGFSNPTYVFGGADSRAIAATDFNRDGKLDLIVANAAVWSPLPAASAPRYGAGLLFGNGDGTFRLVQQIPLNGPQHLVAVPEPVNSMTAAPNIGVAFGGDANYTASPVPLAAIYTVKYAFTDALPIRSFIAFPGVISGLAVGDLNRDGQLDLAAEQTFATNASYGDALVHSFLAQPDGTFSQKANVQTVLLHAAGLSMADLDRDGRLDVAVSGEDGRPLDIPGPAGTLVALPGNGDGTFGAAGIFRPMQIPVSQCLADVNRDGRVDVVMGNQLGAATRINSSRPFWTDAGRLSIEGFAVIDQLVPLV